MPDLTAEQRANLRRLAEAVRLGPANLAPYLDALSPGVVLALLDRIDALEAAAPLLHQLAEARREYAQRNAADRTVLRLEAQAFDNVARVIEGADTWADLVACYAPSWRWPEFGAHDPLLPVAAGADTPAETEETTP